MTDITADLKATPAADAAAPDAAKPDAKPADTKADAKPADKPADSKPTDAKPDAKDTKSKSKTLAKPDPLPGDPEDKIADPDPVKAAKADQKPESFPDNWREMLAGDNKALLNTLKRYASPKTFADAAFALRQKISTGELKSTLPKDATEEQQSEWRKENGIPDKPEDYDLELGDGLVIGENDKPLVNEFVKEMHAANATNDQLKSALKAYYKIEQNLIRETEAKDSDFATQSEDSLRTEWGGDFKKNITLVTGLLDTLPEEVSDRIASARTVDGRKLGDDPDFLRGMAQWARDMGMDTGTLMPSSAPEAMKSLKDEQKAIEAKMGTKDYTPEMRARYADITELMEKQKQRAA